MKELPPHSASEPLGPGWNLTPPIPTQALKGGLVDFQVANGTSGLFLMGLPGGDPRHPLPTLKGDKLKPLEEVINRFQLKSKYKLG